MSDILKVLAQSNPAATTSTDLYTCPAGTMTTVSSLTISNSSGSARTFRVSVAVAGAVLAAKQYLYYDHSIAANDTIHVTIGLTISETDVIRVYASTTDLAFNLFGVETS